MNKYLVTFSEPKPQVISAIAETEQRARETAMLNVLAWGCGTVKKVRIEKIECLGRMDWNN